MTMDLILVVDTSDSIDSAELTLVKEFLQSLVARLVLLLRSVCFHISSAILTH